MVRIKTILAVLSLLSALAGYLPLMPYLDAVAKFFFPAALVAGIYLDRKSFPRGGWVLTALSLLFFVYYGARFSIANVVPVTANLLVTLLAVRLLSEKTGRNYLQIFALSLFCLAASSLYNLSESFLLFLVALLVLLAVSLVLLTFHAHDPELVLDRGGLKKVLGSAFLLPAASLPIMLLLFVVLPRTQYPLWDFMNAQGGAVVGFSERVTPGGAPSAAAVRTPAFRVLSQKLPDDRLYWRGIVMNGFQGDSWVRGVAPEEHPLPMRGGVTVVQTFYPEPSRSPYLLALNFPVSVRGVRNSSSADLVYSAPARSARISYQAVSVLSDRIPVRGGIDRALYLGLPQHLPPRLQGVAAESAAGRAPPEEIVRRLERFFRAQRISYATTDLPTGADPLDRFLFVSRKGNCEYFASSAALFLRLAGVPARLVGGYRGGVYSDTGGYYLVTEDMAHVWVEAYVEGKGWLSIDPSAWSLNFGRSPGVSRARLMVDALGFYWNKAVVTYNLEKQITLLRGAGERIGRISAPQLSPRQLIPGLLVLGALFLLYPLLKSFPRTPSQRILDSFLRAVRRRYPALEGTQGGIFELARQCRDPAVHEFVSLYGSAIYSDRPLTGAELARLKGIVRALREPPPH